MTKKQYRITYASIFATFVAVFLTALFGFYYYSENVQSVMPNDDAEITPLQLYNAGVVKYLAKEPKEAMTLWKNGLSQPTTNNSERFYLHSNLGIGYLTMSTDEKTSAEKRPVYADLAVKHFKDAHSYLQTITEKDGWNDPAGRNIELAKKNYNAIVLKNGAFSDKKPLDIIRELLLKEAKTRNLLATPDNATGKNQNALINQIGSDNKSAEMLLRRLTNPSPPQAF